MRLQADGYAILDRIFAHVFVLDGELRVVHLKPETAAFLGYEAGEIAGQPFESLVVEKQYPSLRWAFDQSRQAQEPPFRRLLFRRRGGGAVALKFSLFSATTRQGEIFGGVGDRVYSPAHMIASQKKGRVKELRALYSIDKLLHGPTRLPEALAEVPTILAAAMMHPQVARVRLMLDGREYGSRALPTRCRKRLSADLVINGARRGEIEIGYLKQSREFLPEELDLLSQVGSVLSDVIERAETAEKLQENSIRLQTLFNAITDLVFMVDGDFRVKMVNRDMDVLGRRCFEAFYGRERPCDDCPAIVVQRTRQPARNIDDERVGDKYYRVRVYPVLDAGGDVTDTLEIVRDVTSEKQLQQQLIQSDKLASLGQLVSGIAHEINNPNTFIRGNISIISEALETILPLLDRCAREDPELRIARLPYPFFRETVETLVSDIKRGADKIMNIVSDLKKFARHDEGLLLEDVDLNVAVESCLRLVHNQIKRVAMVHVGLAEKLPTFKGNVQKIEQVLVNVIINAAQAIEETKQTGNIWIRTINERGAFLRLHVRDDGPGMSEEVRTRIFDPFFTTKRKRQGTGLGLSIAYGIIAEHRGTISVESAPGKGAEFRIAIPLRPPKGEGDRRSASTPPWG
jgi:signal transduction histidine kinase